MPAGAGELDNCLVAHFDRFKAAAAIFLAGCDRSILGDDVWSGEWEEWEEGLEEKGGSLEWLETTVAEQYRQSIWGVAGLRRRWC